MATLSRLSRPPSPRGRSEGGAVPLMQPQPTRPSGTLPYRPRMTPPPAGPLPPRRRTEPSPSRAPLAQRPPSPVTRPPLGSRGSLGGQSRPAAPPSPGLRRAASDPLRPSSQLSSSRRPSSPQNLPLPSRRPPSPGTRPLPSLGARRLSPAPTARRDAAPPIRTPYNPPSSAPPFRTTPLDSQGYLQFTYRAIPSTGLADARAEGYEPFRLTVLAEGSQLCNVLQEVIRAHEYMSWDLARRGPTGDLKPNVTIMNTQVQMILSVLCGFINYHEYVRDAMKAGYEVARDLYRADLSSTRVMNALGARYIAFKRMVGQVVLASTSIRELIASVREYFKSYVDRSRVDKAWRDASPDGLNDVYQWWHCALVYAALLFEAWKAELEEEFTVALAKRADQYPGGPERQQLRVRIECWRDGLAMVDVITFGLCNMTAHFLRTLRERNGLTAEDYARHWSTLRAVLPQKPTRCGPNPVPEPFLMPSKSYPRGILRNPSPPGKWDLPRGRR